MTFKAYLQQQKHSIKSISRHQREIKKYKIWLQNQGKNQEIATKKDLINYLSFIKESRNLQNSTQNMILGLLKNYYKYLSQNGTKNITSFIKIRGKNKQHLKPLFTAEELNLLCDIYFYYTGNYKATNKEKRFYKNQKNLLTGRYIALTLIAYQGLQTNEILALTKQDFDFRKAQINIKESKRGTERILQLEASQIGVLIDFFKSNNQILPNRNHLEKLSKTLKNLTQKPINNITSFEDFRQIRSSKINLWIKEKGLRKAQHLAGHKNINSTEKHQRADVENLQNDLNNYHPLK